LQNARFVAGPSSNRLEAEGRVIELEAISAAYARPHDMREVLRESVGISDVRAAREMLNLDRQLYAWMETTGARVVNRPSAASSNDSKPHQLEKIREHGFAVPASLMTTSPEAVREFVEHYGEVVYKSASCVRSTVTRANASELDSIDAVRHCPTLFQAYIPGVDWRVHVVGDEIHACEIRCPAVDYRLAPEQGVPVEIRTATLPGHVATRCRSLARSLDLALAGIDLRRDPHGVWHCFEVNTSPAFTYYERVTGQHLAAAITQLLVGPGACQGRTYGR
jgi:glutathione synthase/RimK-type ligase-like ATP-grasp enzyme